MISLASINVRALTTIGLVSFACLLMGEQRVIAAIVLYSQPAQSPVVSTRASQTQTTGGLVFQTFDNFQIAADSTITEVAWQGSYFNTNVNDNTFNPPANATGFTVALYADSAGEPGALLSSQFFSPAAANETFVAQQAFSATLGLGVYNYSAALVPFAASGGTTYWLSIYAQSPDANADQAQWGWNGGTGGDGTSMQASFGNRPGEVNTDRAMTLTGHEGIDPAPVPEPATLTLWSMGALGCAVGAYRRRRAG